MRKLLTIILAIAAAAGGAWYLKVYRAPYKPVDAGIPLYPGARNINADTFSSRLSPRDRARLIKAVIYETPDPVEKVVAFYKKSLQEGKTQIFETKRGRLPSAVIRTEASGTPKLITIMWNEDTEKTEVSIGIISDRMPAK